MSTNGDGWVEWKRLVERLLDDFDSERKTNSGFRADTKTTLALIEDHLDTVTDNLHKHTAECTRRKEKRSDRWSNRTWALLIIALGLLLKALEWGLGQILP